MSSINRLIDVIIARIEQWADYIIFEKHVTLSECAIFAMSLLRAVWYIAFGVQIGNLQGTVLSPAWVVAFAGASLLHLISFFFPLQLRIFAVIAQAFLWCVLSLLVAMHDLSTPSVPTFAVLAGVAVFVAFKLMRQNRDNALPRNI